MFAEFSVPGFPFPRQRLPFDRNLHWTNHLFETPASERYFARLFGAATIAPFRPVTGTPHTAAHRQQLADALGQAMFHAVANGDMVSFRYINELGRLREYRVSPCVGRLVLPFACADEETAVLTTTFLKGDAKAARVYVIEKVLMDATDDDGRPVELLPRPTDLIPMSGGQAIYVNCHNPVAF